MSRPPSSIPSSRPTPAPSSPRPSESFMSELDGTASVLDHSAVDFAWDGKADTGSLNLVSWKLDVNARAEDGVEKRGFNAISTVLNHPTKKANPLRSSRIPLPPIAQPLPTLPKPPPPAYYDAYLKSITPLYDVFLASQAPVASDFVSRPPETANPDLPSLEGIPEAFFDPAFDLSDPTTWAEVVNGPSAHVKDAVSNHLDNLERHLIHEITLRSTSFFSALSNLQDLHSESASCLARISDLQTSLQQVGTQQARKGLQVIDAQEQLRILRVTERGNRTVGELDELIRMTKGLVRDGDWAVALGCLEDVKKWWEANGLDEDEHLPLSTLPALSQLPESISSFTTTIATQLESALSSLLLSVLASSDPFDPHRFNGAAQPILAGLKRCGQVDGVKEVWRAVVTTSIREGSRQYLPTAQIEDDGDDEKQFEARSDLATLSISPLTPEVTAPRAPPSVDLSDVIVSSCELANARASKILAVRSEQNSSLSLADFVELFQESWTFVLATESLAKRMIVSLRGVTTSQARAFLVAYHAVRLTRSAKLVEDEQWSQIDVPPSTQHVVDLLIQSAVDDPAECRIPASVDSPNGTKAVPGKTLNIEEKTYFVVKATSESLVLLGDYLKIVINLELVVTDVMSRIIEFLKSFNSRTCQVVLGAGAMRSAGLKNITAKHLALASQSLSVVISIIPYIREFIRRHLNTKQAVMLIEFDKLKRDYQEHQNEIHSKLVAIMSDRLAVHCASLREVDWEATSSKQGPREYAEMLVKETATLHKVLSKYLAQQTVEDVMSQVLAAIVHRLSEEYGSVELKSDEAKKRMTEDVVLLSDRLVPLSESGKAVASLETLVKDKSTPRKPVGQAMVGLLRRAGSTSSNKTAPVADKEPDAATEGQEAEEPDEDEEGVGMTEEPEVMDARGGKGEEEEAVHQKEQDAGSQEITTGATGRVEESSLMTIEAAPPLPSKEAEERVVPEIPPKNDTYHARAPRAMVEKESMIEPQPSVPVDTKPNFSNKDIEQGRAWYHPTSLFWWAVQNWFLIGIGVVVVLAWRWPQVAKDGGIIRSEYSVRFSYWIIGSILMHKQIQYGGIALIFLITGLTLSTSALYKQSKQVYMHIYTQLFSFFFFSAVVFFIVNMVRLSGTTAIDPYTLVGLIVMSVMPTTVASNITMTRNAGGNTEAATMEVFVGNVLGIFITPLLLEMYTSSGPWEYGAPVAAGSVSSTAGLKIIYKDIAKQMGLAIFVPMFVGQVIQSVFPRQTKWVVDKLYLPKVSTFLLLLLIWTAFSTQFANGAFTSVPHAAIIFVVFLNLVVVAGFVDWRYSGGLAGATSRTVVSPLERLKIILQVQATSAKGKNVAGKAYGGVWSGLARMWKEEGIRGFMKGNGVNVIRIIPYSAVQFVSYGAFKNILKKWSGTEDLSTVSRLMAGGGAGIASVVLTYPLDLVRARLSIATANLTTLSSPQSVSRAFTSEDARLGIVGMTKKVYRTEGGIKGLYRGCWATAVGVAPYVSLNFYIYESLKRYILPSTEDAGSIDGGELVARKLACGAVAGGTSLLFTHPFDVLRRKLQVAGVAGLSPQYTGAIDALTKIVKNEGFWKGLYRGLTPNIIKVAPSIAVSFYTFETVRDALASYEGMPEPEEL
ncbi:vacuolar protein sorting-associated protein 54, partial [Tremellales sp. Uapishka_1]